MNAKSPTSQEANEVEPQISQMAQIDDPLFSASAQST